MRHKQLTISIAVGALTFLGLAVCSIHEAKIYRRKKRLQIRHLQHQFMGIVQAHQFINMINHSLQQGHDLSIAIKYASYHLRKGTQFAYNILKMVQINNSAQYTMTDKIKMGLQHLKKQTNNNILKQYIDALSKYNQHQNNLRELQDIAKKYNRYYKKVNHYLKR